MMVKRKILSVFAAFAMVLSVLAGSGMGSIYVHAEGENEGGQNVEGQQTVDVTLPTIPGLYVAEYMDWDHDDEKDSDTVKTGTDASGNTILVNWDGEAVSWRDQDNPEYLTKGMKDEDENAWWGQGFENGQEVWFDYIADGMVTHVNPTDLTIINLDGTPCDDITITTDERDERVGVFHMNTADSQNKKVIITYNGESGNSENPLVNNKIVGDFALRTAYYLSEEASLDTMILDEPTVVRGKTKDIYFHMMDNGWAEAGFTFDAAKAVTIKYWDSEKDREAELSSENETDAAVISEFVTLAPISTDSPQHLIYKLTLKGNDKVDNWFDINVKYTEYNTEDDSDGPWNDDRWIHVKVLDAGLYAAEPGALTVKGNEYYYPEGCEYIDRGYYGAGSLLAPVYMTFKYMNEEEELVPVTDASKLTFYRSEYVEDEDGNGEEVITKVDSSIIKVEKPHTDSDIFKITYVGDTDNEHDWNEFTVTYDGDKPRVGNMDGDLEVTFVSSDFTDIGTYDSGSISDRTYTKEYATDSTSDIVFYIAGVKHDHFVMGKMVETVENISVVLKDENGRDYSDKVILSDESAENAGLTCKVKVTIPKGTLSSAGFITVKGTLKGKCYRPREGAEPPFKDEDLEIVDYSEDNEEPAYILYTHHSHEAVTEWSKDADNHWHVCTADDGEVLDKAAHDWDEGRVITEPTTDKEGVKTYTCKVCKATKIEAVAKLPATSTATQTPIHTDDSDKKTVSAGEKTTDETGATYTVTEASTDTAPQVEYSAADSTEKTVVIPETVKVNGVDAAVTSIADNAFSGNTTVTTVTIPSSVEEIGDNAFSGCTKLKTVTIPESVQEIGAGAFQNCTSLKKITIPKSVESVGKNAFLGCSSLTTVTIKSTTIKTIDQGAFKNCKKLTKVTITKNVTKIGKEAFLGDKKLKTITITSTKIKSIGKNAFKGVPKTTTIKVPKKQKKAYTRLLKKAGFKGKVK